MKILAWNCRGIGGSSTVSQLKESIRFHNPDIVFLSKTKQKKEIMRKVGQQLKCEDRWLVKDPIGRKGGLFVTWDQRVDVQQVWLHEFYIEMKVRSVDGNSDLWIILIYASTDLRERQEQWEFLQKRKQQWGSHWILGGNLNDIKCKEEKKGGKQRNGNEGCYVSR